MDERVLKWITALSGVLAVAVCVSLYFFPSIHAQALAAENQGQEEHRSSAENIIVASDAEDDVEEAEDLDGKLKIALPGSVTEDDISVEDDYLTQTVTVRFPGGMEDYFSDYAIRGSSDHIESLSYYQDGDDGVIVFDLDSVCELEQDFKAGGLYLKFLDPHEVYDKVVVIDAGHGSRAPGAVKQGVYEKNLNLDITLQLKALLDEDDHNIGVYYTRTSDTNPTLDQRVQLANKSGADLFLSIHNNSSASGNFNKTHGTEVMYSESDTSEFSSKRLAQICLDNVTSAAGSRSIGLAKGDSIYIIRTSEVPVALIEVGFMTNHDELDALQDEEYQKQVAQGIYDAILQAFEEGY